MQWQQYKSQDTIIKKKVEKLYTTYVPLIFDMIIDFLDITIQTI